MIAELTSRLENDVELDVLVWRLQRPMLCASTAVAGGGLGPRNWVVNAEVVSDYHRTDVEEHVAELARSFHLGGAGVGMLTAASVSRHELSSDEEVSVDVTVGLSHPTWAASAERGATDTGLPGTINLVAFVPVRLEDGALLNAIATATEAKSQALWKANILATGTPSDAVTILCPLEGDVARFAGPRSSWGSRLARAVHRAVLAGATRTAT